MSAASAGIASERTLAVSVTTPAHNAEIFIAETIASAQAQSLGGWKMLGRGHLRRPHSGRRQSGDRCQSASGHPLHARWCKLRHGARAALKRLVF